VPGRGGLRDPFGSSPERRPSLASRGDTGFAGSPALGAGDPALLGTTDQRGVTRTGAVDVGACQVTGSLT
jgi:hypothetical protein